MQGEETQAGWSEAEEVVQSIWGDQGGYSLQNKVSIGERGEPGDFQLPVKYCPECKTVEYVCRELLKAEERVGCEKIRSTLSSQISLPPARPDSWGTAKSTQKSLASVVENK